MNSYANHFCLKVIQKSNSNVLKDFLMQLFDSMNQITFIIADDENAYTGSDQIVNAMDSNNDSLR